MENKNKRIEKDRYYLNLAYDVSLRSTCIRRQYGAVIVKNDEIISTGYNGSPRNGVNCNDCGYCLREKLGIKSGERYELCRAVHAEQNAIISASRSNMIGATLYLAGRTFIGDSNLCKPINAFPCRLCQRFIINSGIINLITMDEFHNIHKYDVSELHPDDNIDKLLRETKNYA